MKANLKINPKSITKRVFKKKSKDDSPVNSHDNLHTPDSIEDLEYCSKAKEIHSCRETIEMYTYGRGENPKNGLPERALVDYIRNSKLPENFELQPPPQKQFFEPGIEDLVLELQPKGGLEALVLHLIRIGK